MAQSQPSIAQLRAAQPLPPSVTLMRHGVRIDADESAIVERGGVLVRVLPTRDSRDVAVLGVVRIDLPREYYLRRVLNFRQWLRMPTRTRVGIFSEPAVAVDVEQLVVSRGDAGDLQQCKPGDCTTKLSAGEMQRLRDEVDWTSRDVQTTITARARRRMLQYVSDYRALGNAAMPVYEDKAPVRGSDAFAALLDQSTFLQRSAPDITAYLRSYPRGRPAGVTDVLYWSEDAVPRLRPILSVAHLVVVTPPGAVGMSLVASKQIYANHYFEAALEVMSVIDRNDAVTAPASYLVLERRHRFDNLPRGILNIRGRAVSGLRDQLRDMLTRERDQVNGRAVSAPR